MEIFGDEDKDIRKFPRKLDFVSNKLNFLKIYAVNTQVTIKTLLKI